MEYDVAIVGGSLAGSLCAYLLSSSGAKTLLIEAHDEHHVKACGEGLSCLALEALKKMGLETLIEAYPLKGYHIVNQGHHKVIPEDTYPIFGIQREQMGKAFTTLLSQHSLVTRVYQSQVVMLNRNSPRSLELLTSKHDTYYAKHVIISSGVGGLSKIKKQKGRLGATVRWGGMSDHNLPPYVSIHKYKTGEFFITPTSRKTFNMSILSSQGKSSAQSLLDLAKDFLEKHSLSSQFLSKTIGCPILHPGCAPVHPDHAVFQVGDSAECFDPIGGMGMTHAVLSAQLACKIIEATRSAELSEMQAKRLYQKEREKLGAPLRRMTYALYLALSKFPIAAYVPEPPLKYAHRVLSSLTLATVARKVLQPTTFPFQK